MGQKSNTLKHT